VAALVHANANVADTVHFGLHIFVVGPGRIEVGIFVVFLKRLHFLLFFEVE
jgi:hypothetical protein